MGGMIGVGGVGAVQRPERRGKVTVAQGGGGGSGLGTAEPTGAGWETIFYLDGTDDDPPASGIGEYATVSPHAWTDDRGDGVAYVDSRTDAQVFADHGAGPNPNGSGASLQFHHDATNASDGGGANLWVLFEELAGKAGIYGQVYVRFVVNRLGLHPHRKKPWYLGLPGMPGQNNYYANFNPPGPGNTYGDLASHSNMSVPSVAGLYANFVSSLVVKASPGSTGLEGKESDDVVVEWEMKMSSAIGVNDGWLRVHIDGQLMALKDYTGYNQPYDVDDGFTATGLGLYNASPSALTNAINAMIIEGAIQDQNHWGYGSAHQWLWREIKIMGVPVTGNDGTSYSHGSEG